MDKIIDYDIIQSGLMSTLIQGVDSTMANGQGWQPLGSPFIWEVNIAGEPVKKMVCQAMAKYKEADNG